MAFKAQATSGDTTKQYLWLAANWGQQFRLWVYVTPDSAATVAASGYITGQQFLDTMQAGDFFLSLEVGSISDARALVADVATGGLVDLTLHVITESTGSVIDLSDDIFSSLADGSVTYAKIQDVSATSRVLGRKTAGAGSVEELTMSEVLDFVGSAAQGDILYRNATIWTRLAAGTSGQFLQTQGAGADPVWATGGGLNNVVEDTTPQLGGNLDLNGFTITGLVIGTDVQAWDAALDDFAGLTQATNKVPYFDSATTMATLDFQDDDTFATASATAVASSESIKAYVDTNGGAITRGTPVTTTSGTSNDITGVASGADRITFMLDGVSTNGTSNLLLQLGDAGGIEATGYVAGGQDGSTDVNSTIGFPLTATMAAARSIEGEFTLSRYDGNTWKLSGTSTDGGTNNGSFSGTKTLSGELTQLRLTTVNGTDTFDAGAINHLSQT